MQDNFNTVRGTFNDAEQDWITADYPEITSATFKTEDNGEEALTRPSTAIYHKLSNSPTACQANALSEVVSK